MGHPADEVFTPEVAESYDDYYATAHGARVDALERAAVDDLLDGVPRGHLLELGCGTGHWTRYFVARGFEVVATDPSAAMLDVARGGDAAGVSFLRAAGERLPFADASLPAVGAVTVLEFVDDPTAVIREVGRVLRPGGWFIGGFLNAESALGDPTTAGTTVRRGRPFAPDELRALLAPLGSLEVRSCVHLTPGLEILDGTQGAARVPPAFIAVRARLTSRRTSGAAYPPIRLPAVTSCGAPESSRTASPTTTTPAPKVQSPRTVSDVASRSDGAPSGNRASKALIFL